MLTILFFRKNSIPIFNMTMLFSSLCFSLYIFFQSSNVAQNVNNPHSLEGIDGWYFKQHFNVCVGQLYIFNCLDKSWSVICFLLAGRVLKPWLLVDDASFREFIYAKWSQFSIYSFGNVNRRALNSQFLMKCMPSLLCFLFFC